jgi:hypothetical protein
MYFFKKKVNTLESKYDAILTIVGNVVKEVNIIRQAIMHTSVLHNMNNPSSIIVNTVSSHNTQERPLHTIEELESDSEDGSESEYEEESNAEESEHNINMVSTEKCAIDKTCELSDSDSDDDYSPSDSDSESNDDFVGDEEDKEIVFDNSPMELDIETEMAPPLELSEEIHEEEKNNEISVPISLSEIDVVLEPTAEETVPLYSGPSEILDITYEADDHEDVAEKLIEEQEDKESYKKMNIHQLKALVVTKGLVSDASKMKKNEIIRILEGTI